MTGKRCSKCGATKPLEEFSHWAKAKDGLNCHCKACAAAYAKAYTARRIARDAKKLAENPDATKRCSKCKEIKSLLDFNKGQGQCKQCINEYNQLPSVMARNRERQNAYQHANLDQTRARRHGYEIKRRRRLEVVYNGDFTNIDWEILKQTYAGRCAYCGESPDILEMEHVVPLSQGGAHTIENIVPACRHCNAVKRARTPEEAGMKFSVFPESACLDGVQFATYYDEVCQDMQESLTTCPACLGKKAYRFALCAECFEKYGRDIADFPEWLQFLVRDNGRLKYTEAMLYEREIDVADLDHMNEQGDSWGAT